MSLSPEQTTETSLAALISYDDAAARVGNLNEAAAAKLISLLDEWDEIKRKYSELTGKIAGYATDNAAKRLAVRNDIRALLGLPRIASELAGSSRAAERNSSGSVPVTIEW